MTRATLVTFLLGLAVLGSLSGADKPAPSLRVGFASADVTPEVKEGGKPVWLAGFGHKRAATGVADPILARAVVLHDGKAKIALVSVDVVGLFLPTVENIRKELPGFAKVVVSSTHNHEGPDTMGLWGRSPFQSGIDKAYLKNLEAGVVKAVKDADKALAAATAEIGTIAVPELIHDGRQPVIKHDELVALRFRSADKTRKPIGVLVQWNCHPETLDSKNTLVSADYVGYTVKAMSKSQGCPVAYFTGTVGGLMTSLHVPIKSETGESLKDGTFEKTRRFGELLAAAGDKALSAAKPLALTPFEVRSRALFLPMTNKMYMLGRQLGVLDREAFEWKGDTAKAEKVAELITTKALAVRTELNYLRLGDLDVACIPGEIYPELVLGKVPDPAPEGADYPDAPREPSIYAQMKGKHKMLLGLACDELGYILPKRQWDEKPPFTYGLKKAPYGEINSLGPETAPLLCEAFAKIAK